MLFYLSACMYICSKAPVRQIFVQHMLNCIKGNSTYFYISLNLWWFFKTPVFLKTHFQVLYSIWCIKCQIVSFIDLDIMALCFSSYPRESSQFYHFSIRTGAWIPHMFSILHKFILQLLNGQIIIYFVYSTEASFELCKWFSLFENYWLNAKYVHHQ